MSASHGTLSRMRPALKPGLLPVWRDRDTLQIGIDPRRAVALTGMGSAAAVLGLLDGSRDREQVIAAAADRGIQAEAADRVITLLTAAGTLCDFPASTIATVPDEARARLAAELATASLAHGDGDGGAHVLVRRQGAAIRVHGTGQVGSCIASLLAASGIGCVVSVGPAAPHGRPGRDAPPGPRREAPGDTEPGREAARSSGPGRQPRPGNRFRACPGPYPAPRGLSGRGDRCRRAPGRGRAVGLLTLPRPGPERPRSGLAAHPRPTGWPAARSARLRCAARSGGRRPGRRAGPRFHRSPRRS